MPSFTQNFIMVATAGPAAPSQASAAGFTRLAFNDDFTSNTVAQSSSVTSGAKWFWGRMSSISQASVATSGTGILTLNGTSGNSGNIGVLQSVPSSISSLSTPGLWNHGYFEAYVQFDTSNNSTGSGWPGFWSWSAEGQIANNSNEHTEVDFMEYEKSSPPTYGCWLHEWVGGGQKGVSSFRGATIDSNWHVYGCLWTGNGSTGTVQFYFDNHPVGSAQSVGSGSTFSALERQHQYIALSAGAGWPVKFDWIRVWN